jgi:hypothetical protein
MFSFVALVLPSYLQDKTKINWDAGVFTETQNKKTVYSLQFHCESRLENSYLLLFLFVNLLNGTEDSKPSRGGQNVGTLIFRFLISVCADIFVPTLPFAEMAWIVYLSITHK